MRRTFIWCLLAALTVAVLILSGPTLSQPTTAAHTAALSACLRQSGLSAAVARTGRMESGPAKGPGVPTAAPASEGKA